MELTTLKIYKGETLKPEEAAQGLSSFGYRLVKDIMEPGEFRIKGEILDVFPCGYEYPIRVEWDWDEISSIRGFDLETVIFISKHDFIIVPPFIKHKNKIVINEKDLLEFSLDIVEGDYVVHLDYGVGIYRGRKKIETLKGVKDFVEIEYAKQEKISISVEHIDLIQKYQSFSQRGPKLSRLGSKDWLNTKIRVQHSIKRFAVDLVKEEAKRELLGGISFVKTQWQDEFNSSFAYKETPDQITAWQEVLSDMESNKPMDRLLCGDVGYGKTEIALRAAFKAVVNSKQVAFLVPTTILAEQHYLNFKKRLKKFPLRVEMLSRFKNRKEQKDVIKDLKEGTVDIVIGTHRILSKDLEFKDLGFLIIDEEQRFGVKHKQILRNIRIGVDVLTLTATPIPRTLYLSLSGIKAISMIRTPPKNRVAVKSEVTRFNKNLLKEVILREINRGGQVFIVENWIKNIPKMIKALNEVLGDKVKIAVAHGRTPGHELEQIMLKFGDGQLDCLISTAIIESGIDIPMANTLIVNNAHMFGLGDLHQLRGRVGRLDRQAYAYFLVPPKETLGQEARQRLECIEEYAYLGAGFEIAMRDLELRGAGNIIGAEQHGFIYQIGLDLYCRLLRIEVESQKEQSNINV